MKLIIDIPKANYEKMKIMDGKGTLENPYIMAIAQGTPLLKEQEPKTAHWVWINDSVYQCSVCRKLTCFEGIYCPNCGAKIIGRIVI